MPRDNPADAQPLWRRLGWMLVFWCLGVAAVASVAAVIKFWLRA